MKLTSIYIFILLSVLLQAKTTDNIVGKWESVETDEEGSHKILRFDSNGSLFANYRAVHNGTYKLQGNHLVINFFWANSKVERESLEIKINRNTLTFRGMQGHGEITGIRLDRSTPHGPTIIGRWAFNHAIPEGKWEIVFNKNGQFTSKVEGHPEKASYKINGDLLIVNRDEDEDETAKFWFEGGFLFFKWPLEAGSVGKFRRIE